MDGTVGSDRLISLNRSGQRRYFVLDGLRSVVNLTDDTGAATASYHLDAWGNYRFPSELNPPGDAISAKNRFGFTGHIYDSETDLYFAKARYYDPETGRFTTQDSFLGQADAPPSLHRYFYGYANPTRYVDPSGHVMVTAEQARAMAEGSRETARFLGDVGTALKVEGQVLGEMAKDAFVGTAVLGAKTALFFHPNPRISKQAGEDLGRDLQALKREVVAHGEATGQVLANPSVVLDSIEELGVEGSVRPYFRTAVTTTLVVDAGAAAVTKVRGMAVRARNNPSPGEAADVVRESGHGRGQAPQASESVSTSAEPAADPAVTPVTSLPPRPADSPYYSTIYEAQLREGTSGASDASHFRQGNRQLHELFQSDPALAQRMEQEFPGIVEHVRPGPRGGVADTAPPGTTWHHHPQQEGALQLVPRSQHRAPGPIQESLHPQGRGGRENWGGGRGAKQKAAEVKDTAEKEAVNTSQ